jgi:hypothetical protein
MIGVKNASCTTHQVFSGTLDNFTTIDLVDKTDGMSLDFKVYCKEVSAALIPKMIKRLNDYDMVVNVHPFCLFNNSNLLLSLLQT